MSDELIYVGVDDGYRQTKIVTSEGQAVVVPSAVRSGFTLTTLREGEDAGVGGYETGGRQFTVDREIDGEDTRFDEYAVSDINRVMVNHAMQLAGLSGKRVALATGLPFESFYAAGTNEVNQKLIARKIENLQQEVRSLNGQPSPAIDRHRVTAQGLAAYVDYLTADNGMVREDLDPKAPVAVVDIGGRTTDSVTIYGGGKLDHTKSGTGNIGVADVYEKIAHALKRKFDVSHIRLAALELVCRERRVRLRGQTHDVNDIVTSAIQEVGEVIVREVQRRIGDAAEMESVLLVGGGAVLMRDVVAARYPHCKVPDAPEFANARGMMKFIRFIAD